MQRWGRVYSRHTIRKVAKDPLRKAMVMALRFGRTDLW